MTHQQLLWKIERLAKMAAEASMDAHGDIVPAQQVWEFMRQVCADTGGETYGDMAYFESMPRQFAIYYRLRGTELTTRSAA